MNRMLVAFSGLVMAILWEVAVGGIDCFRLTLHPGMIGYLAISFICPVMVRKQLNLNAEPVWLFSVMVVIGDLGFMATRNVYTINNGAPFMTAIIGGTAFLSITAACRNGRTEVLRQVIVAHYSLIHVSAVLAIVFFQTTNRLLRLLDVPNEGRSLVVSGVEIHHLNLGIVALVFLVPVSNGIRNTNVPKYILAVAMGLSLGTLWDEWYYYMSSEVTDDAYFEATNCVAASVAVLCSFVCGMRPSCSRLRDLGG